MVFSSIFKMVIYNPAAYQALMSGSEIIGKIPVVVNLIPTMNACFMSMEEYRQKLYTRSERFS